MEWTSIMNLIHKDCFVIRSDDLPLELVFTTYAIHAGLQRNPVWTKSILHLGWRDPVSNSFLREEETRLYSFTTNSVVNKSYREY